MGMKASHECDTRLHVRPVHNFLHQSHQLLQSWKTTKLTPILKLVEITTCLHLFCYMLFFQRWILASLPFEPCPWPKQNRFQSGSLQACAASELCHLPPANLATGAPRVMTPMNAGRYDGLYGWATCYCHTMMVGENCSRCSCLRSRRPSQLFTGSYSWCHMVPPSRPRDPDVSAPRLVLPYNPAFATPRRIFHRSQGHSERCCCEVGLTLAFKEYETKCEETLMSSVKKETVGWFVMWEIPHDEPPNLQYG